MLLTTLFINSMELATISNPADTVPSEVDNSISGLYSVMSTFFNLLTFRIPEVPTLFNLVFVVIAIGILYVIVDILKDVIPFT